ncbi:MAG: hypothetical protein HY907_17730 [Deltaproteobacteria bacterium]|nr:hypothetical protein [Deltaproteobacteria bacterium]
MTAPARESRTSLPPPASEETPADVQARLPTDLVLAIFRLVRGCGLHADSNSAVIALVDSARQVLGEFCERLGAPHASILVADNAAFVNGRQLRARREAYGSAMELGRLMEECGFNELTLRAAASRQDVATFARAFSDALHGQSRSASLHGATFGGIRLRKVRSNPFGAESEDQSPSARTVRSYAAAVVVVRDFLEDLLRGSGILPNRLKRVSQRLVSQFEEDPRMLLALTATTTAGPDEALTSVHTAVLAVATARQLTDDRVLLANLAMAAMTYGVGRVRMTAIPDPTGGSGGTLRRQLRDDEAARLPAATTADLVGLGKIHPPNMVRTVMTHEALWLRHAQSRGPVYQGRWAPTVLARILDVARSFAELLVPAPGTGTVAVEDALERLSGRTADATARTYLKLLVGALGIFPIGTVVELDTGEVAVVLGTPARAGDFARPPVRIINDKHGELLSEPLDVDLALPAAPGQPRRFIRHPVEADESQMKAMRSYVASLGLARPTPRGTPVEHVLPPGPSAPVPVPASRPVDDFPRPSRPVDDAPRPSRPSAPSRPSVPRVDPTHAVSREEYQARLSAVRASQAPAARVSRPSAAPAARPPGDAPRPSRPSSPSRPSVPRVDPTRPSVPSADPTRAVSWDEYRERLAGKPEPPPPAPAGQAGADALAAKLKAYLSEEPPAPDPRPSRVPPRRDR